MIFFITEYIPTLGVEVNPVTIENTRFNIWDSAGQEKFSGMKENHYGNAQCGLICFDLGNQTTFNNALKWFQSIQEYTPNLGLVGFKSDLPARVSQDDILALTMSLELPYFEISSRTGDGLTAPLEYLKTN